MTGDVQNSRILLHHLLEAFLRGGLELHNNFVLALAGGLPYHINLFLDIQLSASFARWINQRRRINHTDV